MSEIRTLEDVKTNVIDEGKFDKNATVRPGDAKAKSVMSLNVNLDESATKPQELNKIRPYYDTAKEVPSSLVPEAQIVLHSLLSCFDRQKEVKEGKLDDLVWGFEQAGVPGGCTVIGLQALVKQGYLKLQAPDNTFVDMTSDRIKECWVRYERRLLDLVYEGVGGSKV